MENLVLHTIPGLKLPVNKILCYLHIGVRLRALRLNPPLDLHSWLSEDYLSFLPLSVSLSIVTHSNARFRYN